MVIPVNSSHSLRSSDTTNGYQWPIYNDYKLLKMVIHGYIHGIITSMISYSIHLLLELDDRLGNPLEVGLSFVNGRIFHCNV